MNATNDVYQLPLRMTKTLANALTNASSATGISRSKLCRMGLSRVLEDLNQTGRTHSMQQFNAHYKELV
jgi:hypothetical protein